MGHKIIKTRDPNVVKPLIEILNTPLITLKEWEHMIETSLKVADRVIKQDMVSGELARYNRCEWEYWPFRFETGWENVKGDLVILTFGAVNIYNGSRIRIDTTQRYRTMLVEADQLRKAVFR